MHGKNLFRLFLNFAKTFYSKSHLQMNRVCRSSLPAGGVRNAGDIKYFTVMVYVEYYYVLYKHLRLACFPHTTLTLSLQAKPR